MLSFLVGNKQMMFYIPSLTDIERSYVVSYFMMNGAMVLIVFVWGLLY